MLLYAVFDSQIAAEWVKEADRTRVDQKLRETVLDFGVTETLVHHAMRSVARFETLDGLGVRQTASQKTTLVQ